MTRVRHHAVLLLVSVFTLPSLSAFGQDSTLFLETFDERPAPQLPTGWTSQPAGEWTTSGSSSSPGSGGQNASLSGADSAGLLTPVFDLQSMASGVLRYQARRTSTFDRAALSVEAIIDGGASTVEIVAAGAALPVVTSSYEEMSATLPPSVIGESSVQFRFAAEGGTGGNVRIDDFLLAGEGDVGYTWMGFDPDSGSALASPDTVSIPLFLNVAGAGVGISAIQFDYQVTAGIQVVGLERGPAVMDPSDWDVDWSQGADSGRVVVLGRSQSGIGPGAYGGVVSLLVRPGDALEAVTRTDSISIDGIVGARAADTGDDAGLLGRGTVYRLTLAPPLAVFRATPDTLDFGRIEPDSVEVRSFLISNDGGNIDLVGTVSASAGFISVNPDSFVVGPNESTLVTAGVDAGVTGSGPVYGSIAITHNGASSPDTIRVLADVGAIDTRGDVNDDSATDLVDLVLAVDFVLGRISIGSELIGRIDLYPWGAADGAHDVRDLTVLVRAINRGMWPDGTSLQSGRTVAKRVGEVGRFTISSSGGTQVIRAEYEGLRAIRLVLWRPSGLRASQVKKPNLSDGDRLYVDEVELGSQRAVSLILYSEVGPLDEGGVVGVAQAELAGVDDSLSVIQAEGVNVDYRRVRLEEVVWQGTRAAGLELRSAYPSPFSLSSHSGLRVPVVASTAHKAVVSLFDVLGRRLASSEVDIRAGRSELTLTEEHLARAYGVAGLYLVEIQSEAGLARVPFTVIP